MNVVIRSEQCDRLLDTLHSMHTMPFDQTKSLISSKVGSFVEQEKKNAKVCFFIQVWKEFASALSSILTLVPHAINKTSSSSCSYSSSNQENKDDSLISALGNASSVLSLATNALVSSDKQQHQDTPSSPSTSKLRRRITSTVKSRATLSRKTATTTTTTHSSPFPPFSSQHQQQQYPSSTPALCPIDADIERVQRISYDVLLHLQQLIMQIDCSSNEECMNPSDISVSDK